MVAVHRAENDRSALCGGKNLLLKTLDPLLVARLIC